MGEIPLLLICLVCIAVGFIASIIIDVMFWFIWIYRPIAKQPTSRLRSLQKTIDLVIEGREEQNEGEGE